MTDTEIWIAVSVIAITTAALRVLPFLLFGRGKKTPRIVKKLSRTLPLAIIGMLVVYCLRGVSFTSPAGFVPALVACVVVAVLHIWRRNTLVSILSGTVCYMLLVQLAF